MHPSAKPLAFLTQVNLNVTSVLPAGTLELARVLCVWARACHVCLGCSQQLQRGQESTFSQHLLSGSQR